MTKDRKGDPISASLRVLDEETRINHVTQNTLLQKQTFLKNTNHFLGHGDEN